MAFGVTEPVRTPAPEFAFVPACAQTGVIRCGELQRGAGVIPGGVHDLHAEHITEIPQAPVEFRREQFDAAQVGDVVDWFVRVRAHRRPGPREALSKPCRMGTLQRKWNFPGKLPARTGKPETTSNP